MRATSHEEVPETDATLDQGAAFLSAFKRGTKEAFNQLVELYNDEGTRYATHLCHGDVYTAEDVLQEAWFNVFRSCMTFDEGRAFAPWFMRVIKHAFWDHQRKQNVLKRRGATEPLPLFIADPRCGTAVTDIRMDLQEALASQTPDVRALLEERYLQEVPAMEIARQAGLTKNDIHYRLCKARRQLASALS